MQQLTMKSMAEELDARLKALDEDGVEPKYILLGQIVFGCLVAEIRIRGGEREPRSYRDIPIVLDPDYRYRLVVVGDIFETIERMKRGGNKK